MNHSGGRFGPSATWTLGALAHVGSCADRQFGCGSAALGRVSGSSKAGVRMSGPIRGFEALSMSRSDRRPKPIQFIPREWSPRCSPSSRFRLWRSWCLFCWWFWQAHLCSGGLSCGSGWACFARWGGRSGHGGGSGILCRRGGSSTSRRSRSRSRSWSRGRGRCRCRCRCGGRGWPVVRGGWSCSGWLLAGVSGVVGCDEGSSCLCRVRGPSGAGS